MQKKNLRFTKAKAEQFYKALVGSAKGMEQKDESWSLSNGHMGYSAWISDGAIYCQISLGGLVIDSVFCNFETCEIDWKRTDAFRESVRNEIKYSSREHLAWQLEQAGIEIPSSIKI